MVGVSKGKNIEINKKEQDPNKLYLNLVYSVTYTIYECRNIEQFKIGGRYMSKVIGIDLGTTNLCISNGWEKS